MLTKNTRHTHKHSQTNSVVVAVKTAYFIIEKYQFFEILEKKNNFLNFFKIICAQSSTQFSVFYLLHSL